jgi:hypothetical protein
MDVSFQCIIDYYTLIFFVLLHFRFFSTLCFKILILYYRDEGVIDNEGLGRKSSKRCCIFHKARAFGESSTDSSDYDSADDKNNKKKIARKKQGGIGNDKKKTPDHLRFHA